MIAFLCSGCGKSLKVKDEFAGRKGRCPHCQQPMTVPSVADAARERTEQAGHDNYSEADAKTVLPSALDGDRDPRTILPAMPRGKSGMKKGNTVIPDAPTGGDAELYDFLSPPIEADEIGRLGTYRVLKVLGAGGMGVVFQAEDPKLKRLVALKAMLPALAASGSNKERFLREARAAAAIEHDHIIPIFQVDEDRGVPFIAMPFLRGESLEDRLKRQRKLPVEEALRIAKETAEGLGAAHERNMIHRDIKPANIWLEGEKGRVKILDFGLARTASGESNLTQQGAIVGTPSYMAPEQGAGKPVDTRCDLFSLGCVLYRMVTGTLPFKGADTVSTLVAVATETPTPPRKLNPQVSPRLSRLIMELLAKDPIDRPPSALSLVDLIEELENEPPADATEMLDESAPPARAFRAQDDDLDHDTVRGRALDDEEFDKPARRSLVLPLLLGGGAGCLGLLLIGVAALVFFLNRGDKTEVAQDNTSLVQNNTIKPQPANQNPNPIRNPKPNPNPQPGSGFPGANPNPVNNTGSDREPPKDNGSDDNPIGTRPRRRPARNEAREADNKYKRYTSAVKGLLFAPDGKHFFSFAERTARVDYWELESGKILRSFQLGGNIQHFVLSTDGSRLLAYNNGGLLCWDVDGGQPLPVTPPLGMTIVGGGFTADKAVCAALCAKGPAGTVVYIYNHGVGSLLPVLDPKTRKPLLDRKKKPVPLPFAHPGTEVERVFFGSDGKHFLTWSKDNMFRAWDTEDPSRITKFPVSPGEAKSIAVSPDFKRIMASFSQPEFLVYDVETGSELKEIKPDGIGSTDSVAFGGENNIGAAARFGGPTRVYNLEEGTIKKEVKGIAFTSAIALAPDGKTLLCGDISGAIHVFKLDE